MDRHRFVWLAVVAFGLVILSFVVLGFSRLVLPFRFAQLLAFPLGIAGVSLAGYLFVRATAEYVGLWSIEDS